MTMSASCSMEPLSLRSASCGRLLSRDSTLRDNCDAASTGTSNSRATCFSACEMAEISCTRLWSLRGPGAVINCR
jgi:hypothetical protein